MNQSAQALIWSIEDVKDGRFWTFTVPNRQSAKLTAAMWGRTAQELKRSLGFKGLRVFEMHPNGHGLHVHVVTDKYFNVRAVRKITSRMGWGRLHVCRIRKGHADGFRMGNVALYLAKYLVKGVRLRKEWGLKGFRMWASFGGWKDYIRTRQVQFDTPIKTIISLLSGQQVFDYWGPVKCCTREKFNYWRMRLACAIYNNRTGDVFEDVLEMALSPCAL